MGVAGSRAKDIERNWINSCVDQSDGFKCMAVTIATVATMTNPRLAEALPVRDILQIDLQGNDVGRIVVTDSNVDFPIAAHVEFHSFDEVAAIA